MSLSCWKTAVPLTHCLKVNEQQDERKRNEGKTEFYVTTRAKKLIPSIHLQQAGLLQPPFQ